MCMIMPVESLVEGYEFRDVPSHLFFSLCSIGPLIFWVLFFV